MEKSVYDFLLLFIKFEKRLTILCLIEFMISGVLSSIKLSFLEKRLSLEIDVVLCKDFNFSM